MNSSEILPAPGVPFYTPKQGLPAGTAFDKQRSEKPVPKVFEPLKIRGVEFPNRIFLSPMCQYSAKDGFVTPWHLAHRNWRDHKSRSQKIGIQLGHAGRKASIAAAWLDGNGLATKEDGGWPDDIWGPSSIPFAPGFPTPKELTVEKIKELVTAFSDGARRAVAAGFDVIEIHSAHGFLLSSFLSPTSNKRTDEYGGSFENRIRFTLEVVDAVREIIPETMPLFLRISGTEWLEVVAPNEPSWTSEDTVELASILADHDVDLLDVSTGGNSPLQELRSGPEYQVPFAAAVKKAHGSNILVGAVGGLFEAKAVESVLESGRADVVFIGRQFQKNPGQVWAIADELEVDVKFASQMQWGFRGRGKLWLGSHKS